MIKARVEDWTYKELLLEVAKRKYERLSEENKRVLLRKDNCVKIKQFPKLESLVKMRHAKIISTLRFFPLCDHFGKTEAQFHEGSLTKGQAFDLAASFISQRQSFHSMERIGETEACLEASVRRHGPGPEEVEAEEAMAATFDELAAELKPRASPMLLKLGASSDSSGVTSESSDDVGPIDSEEEAKTADPQGPTLDSSSLQFLADAGILE